MDGTRTMTEDVRDYRTQAVGRTGETKPAPRMGWLWGGIGLVLLGWLIALFVAGDRPGNAFASGAGESPGNPVENVATVDSQGADAVATDAASANVESEEPAVISTTPPADQPASQGEQAGNALSTDDEDTVPLVTQGGVPVVTQDGDQVVVPQSGQ